MLAKEESLFPAMYANMRRAFVPLMDENAYEAMRKTSDMVCWGFPPVQLFAVLDFIDARGAVGSSWYCLGLDEVLLGSGLTRCSWAPA